MINHQLIVQMLTRWADAAEQYWYEIPGHEGRLGCYGSGYNAWGVQTNQKYISAMAALAIHGDDEPLQERCRDRALAALRFSLASHQSGELCCTDGTRWGHTWISALGVERMMQGVALLKPWLTDEDQAALKRMLTSESQWLYENHPVDGDIWNSSGKNKPESNLWNGAIQWRTAQMYRDHPQAENWRQRGREFLINAVSIPADADTQPLYIGANFFPNYALDHHGYLNVGYMVICSSNAAILHFDLRQLDLERPAELDHHQQDLWSVVRRMIFTDGRLCRIGGDTRVRYAYCQEYLLPALLYAADHFDDQYAIALANEQLKLIEQEQVTNPDGSFYGGRLGWLIENTPYYYTRLESDRANVLAMALIYGGLIDGKVYDRAKDVGGFENDVAGNWCEPQHGAVMHRSKKRIASFAWRANGLTQGMCLPGDASDLAEWERNLAGWVEFLHTPYWGDQHGTPMREIICHEIEEFDGGFATVGCVTEGANVELAEGWRGQGLATHHIAFAALPDGQTVVGIQLCIVNEKRIYLKHVHGLNLNLPNDLYNDFSRKVYGESGELKLTAPAEDTRAVEVMGNWLNVEGRTGLLGLYGSDRFTIDRAKQRRGGRYRSLHQEKIAWNYESGTRAVDAGSVILDCAWAVASGVGVDETREWAGVNQIDPTLPGKTDTSLIRTIAITALDGITYTVTAKFSAEQPTINVSPTKGL